MKETRSDIRMSAELRRQIDRWRAAHEEIPSRADAVRTLIEVGLRNYRLPPRRKVPDATDQKHEP